jgi:hypothetical protein
LSFDSDEIGVLQDNVINLKVELDKHQSLLAKAEVKLEHQVTVIEKLENQLTEGYCAHFYEKFHEMS